MALLRSTLHMLWMLVTVIPWAIIMLVASIWIRGNRLYWMAVRWLRWTIAAAQASRCVDRLVLSSDDPGIIAIAEGLGCAAPCRRAAALPGDAASSVDVVLDAL
ncbi:MAG: hypothetical protein ACK4MJ_10030, partial [Hylemonella sp.]